MLGVQHKSEPFSSRSQAGETSVSVSSDTPANPPLLTSSVFGLGVVCSGILQRTVAASPKKTPNVHSVADHEQAAETAAPRDSSNSQEWTPQSPGLC